MIGGLNLTWEQVSRLQLENATEQDLEIIPVEETMNSGKTVDWLEYALQRFPTAKYVAKMDQDSFVHPPNLVEQLTRLPTLNLLYGFDCGQNGVRQWLGESILNGNAFTKPLNTKGKFENPWTRDVSGARMQRPLLFPCGKFYLFSRD